MSKIIEQPRYICALGAQQTVLGIKRAIPIVHAGPGCSSKISSALGEHAGFQGGGYAGGSAIPSTNAGEREVIFGGEEKLRKTIDGTLKVMDGDLFVVLTGCTADIVGDDTAQVAADYRRRGIPIVSVETGGFKGNNFLGHEMVLEAIIEQWVGEAEPRVKKGAVNVFSVLPFQNPYWRGDLDVIKTLLRKIGLEANVLFGQGADGLVSWEKLPHAEFNLVLSPWVGLPAAELLAEKYGTPFLHYPVLPIGAVESGRFLRTVGAFANIDPGKIEDVIAKEEEVYYDYLIGTVNFMTENRNSLPPRFFSIADAGYTLAIDHFLVQEIGLRPGPQFITDNPSPERRDAIYRAFSARDGLGSPIFEDDGGKIAALLAEEDRPVEGAFVFASSWDKDLAREQKGILLTIAPPLYNRLLLNKTYLGYGGGLHLLEDMYGVVLEQEK